MIRKIIKFSVVLLLIALLGVSTFVVSEWESTKMFRSNTGWPVWSHYYHAYKLKYPAFTRKGLDRYNVMGSARINFDQFKNIQSSWPGKIHVLNADLNSFYYYREKNIKKYCLSVEGDRIKSFHRSKFLDQAECHYNRLKDSLDVIPEIKDLETEDTILKRMGFDLMRPFPEDWLNDWLYVEGLVNFFEATLKEDLIYFHCDHGKGRTTTFMALLDIFHNAHDLSLEEIITRQYILGGIDLFDIKPWQNGTWKEEHLKARLNLVSSFYDYMKSPDGYTIKTPWSLWLQKHPKDPQSTPNILSKVAP